MEYTASIDVGFRFTLGQLIEPFLQHRPEKFHMEDRYDPKTGKKITPIKVVDEEEADLVVFDGKTFEEDEHYEFLDILCNKLNCTHAEVGDMCVWDEDGTVILGVKLPESTDDGCEFGKAYFGSSYRFKDIVGLQKELTKLRKAIAKLYGPKYVPEAEVVLAWDAQ